MRWPVIIFALSFVGILLSCNESGEVLQTGSGSETVYGHLVDTLGEPALDASIALLRPSGSTDSIVYDTAAHTETDGRGKYEFSSVEQGKYALHALSDDGALVLFREGIEYKKTDAPYNLGTDTLRAPGRVVGRITYRGVGVGGAICYVRGLPALDITDTSGVFELDSLVSGNRVLRCSPPSPFSMITVPIEILPGSMVELGDLVLTPDPNEEPPCVVDLSASFDTTTGVVSLEWPAVSVGDLKGYEVYRNTPEGVYEQLPVVVTQPRFQDTLAGSSVVLRDQIKYYVVAVDTTAKRSRKPSPISTVFPAPRESVMTSCSISVSANVPVAIGDTAELHASYRNPTRKNVAVQWYVNSAEKPVAEHAVEGQTGVDTLTYVWAESGEHRVWVRFADEAGDHWWDSVVVTVATRTLHAGTWNRLPDGPFKGPTTVCGVSNGKIYVISRANNQLDRWYSVYEYSVSAVEWRMVAPLRENVQAAGAALHNGRIYVVGGESADSGVLQTVQYRTLSDTVWQYGPDLPGKRRDAALVSADGRMVLLGGRTRKPFNQVYEFSSTWTLVEAMNADRACFPAVIVKDRGDSHLFVFGGNGRAGIHGTVERRALNGENGQWLTIAHMPTPRMGHAASVYRETLIVVAGGRTAFGVTGIAEQFDCRNRTWTKLDSLPTPRSDLGLATAEGRIYAIGGIDPDGLAVGTVEVYVP